MLATDSSPDVASWLNVRDPGKALDLSVGYIHVLMRMGKLRGVRTRAGWLIDPRSVAELKAERATRTEASV